MEYKDAFQEREYFIMIQKERHKKTLKEIAGMIGVTPERVRQLYVHAKSTQKRVYMKKILEVTGQSVEIFYLERRLWEKYKDNRYVVAYLEREYGDILSVYRNGEPESSYKIDENGNPIRL